MGIGRKVLMLNIAMTILSVVLIFTIGHQIWNTGSLALEKNDVQQNTNRAHRAWVEEVDVLSSVVSDWAPWDEMYTFAQQPWDNEFVKNNLDDAMLENFKINTVIITNNRGEITYTKNIALREQENTLVPEDFIPHIQKINELLLTTTIRDNTIKGFIMMDNFPVLVSAQRISTSTFGGTSPGILILIRNADADYVKQIARRVQVEMIFIVNHEMESAQTPAYWQDITDEKQVKGYQVIADIYGKRGYLLETTMAREIYQQGQQQMKSYAGLTLLLGISIAFITLILLEKLVLGRLRKLDAFMKTIVDGENVTMRLDLTGNDELARTATIMNSMLDRVSDTQEKLRFLSLHDGLTGLYNRTFFDQEINRVNDYNYQSIGVISCDVDGLKFVNDTLGHSAGDEMLIQMAKILTMVYKNKGQVIRMGGDEFIILIADVDEGYIRFSCQSINQSLETVNLWRNGFKLRISIGWEYSDNQPITNKTIVAMLEKADDAMYRHKLASNFEKRRLMMEEVLRMLDSRICINEGHRERLSAMTVDLGKKLGLSEAKLENLKALSKFHDLGMIGISDWIIFKEEALTTQEHREFERHVEIGYRIAQAIPELLNIADLILKHREWWNGKGYPIGLQGLEIPIEDRVFSIVHAYEERINDLPFRKAITQKEAVREIQQLSGIEFDPDLVDLFTEIITDSSGKK